MGNNLSYRIQLQQILWETMTMSSTVQLAYIYKNLVIEKVSGGTFDKIIK